MLDFSHVPTRDNFNGRDQEWFYANSPVAGQNWTTWRKPRGVKMVSLFMLGGGGGGGIGTTGAASTAGGGAGGGSSAQYNFLFPAYLLPDTLYFSIGMGGTGGTTAAGTGVAGITSYISLYTSSLANYLFGIAAPGSGGQGATGATTGTVGAAGAASAISAAPLAALGYSLGFATAGNITLAGMAGASAITLSVTGLLVTGGTNGGGLPALSTAGNAGGSFTVPTFYPTHAGGLGGANSNAPGGDGPSGFRPFPKINYFYGGTGGGSGGLSSPGNATARGGAGGNGSYGCGGGGSGGSFTGATRQPGGKGGDGLVIVTYW